MMSNFWKTAILLATIVAAGHCLTCRRCPITILDTCLFGSDITCDNATQSCYRGTIDFNGGESGSISLCFRGCTDSTLCGPVVNGSVLDNSFAATLDCCNTDLCNSAASVQLSLTMAVCVAIFLLWAM